MPPHISIRPIQPSDFAAWKLLLRATTLSMAAKARLLCPIRSRRPLSNVSLRRFFDNGEPVHALVATARDASSRAGSEQLVGLVHYLFHRSTTRLHDVCYLQDLNALPRIAANASPQTSLQPCTPPLPSVAAAAFTGPPKPPTPAAAPSTTNSPCMRGLSCIRMSFRRPPRLFHTTRSPATRRA